jgi:hypothetical protein
VQACRRERGGPYGDLRELKTVGIDVLGWAGYTERGNDCSGTVPYRGCGTHDTDFGFVPVFGVAALTNRNEFGPQPLDIGA